MRDKGAREKGHDGSRARGPLGSHGQTPRRRRVSVVTSKRLLPMVNVAGNARLDAVQQRVTAVRRG
jgi:hypothetical protein